MADDVEYSSYESSAEDEEPYKGTRSAPAGRRLRPYIWQKTWSGTTFVSKKIKRASKSTVPDTPSRNPDVGKPRPKRRISFGAAKVNAPPGKVPRIG